MTGRTRFLRRARELLIVGVAGLRRAVYTASAPAVNGTCRASRQVPS